VLHDAADRFGSHAGAIIFSGMTDDAVEGCRYLAAKGGLVYAQRQDTSVVSTMIDGVCEAGVVSFLGSPQELAEKLLAG
jgi:chemotaxis response regulator CheB